MGWAELNAEAMEGAQKLQATALAAISASFGGGLPEARQDEISYETFVDELDKYGHKFGEPCLCPICLKTSAFLSNTILELMGAANGRA